MKTISGFNDILIVLAMMVANIPLLLLLVIRMQFDTFYYLDDKSIYSFPYEIEYSVDKPYFSIPKDMSQISINYTQAIMLPAMQDDYLPKYDSIKINGITKSAQKIIYDYDSKAVDTKYNKDALGNLIQESGGIEEEFKCRTSIKIHEGWDAEIIDTLKEVENKAGTNQDWINYHDKKFYLIWNTRENAWVVTGSELPYLGDV